MKVILKSNFDIPFTVGYVGFSLNGFNAPALMNVVDLAPERSGTVTGVTNGVSAAAGFLVPAVVASATREDPADPAGWRTAFASGKQTCSICDPLIL